MSSRTRWSGFQGLCYRFIGVSASGVLLTLEWRCGSGSHWSDVCRLSGSFHTLHMAKVKGAGPDSDGFPGLLDMFFFTSIPAWQPKATMWGKKETLRTYRENVNRPVTVPLLQVFSAHSLEFSGSTSDWLRELFGTSSITHWTSFELFCLDKIRTQDWWHVQTRLLQSADFIPESWNHHSKIIQSKKKTTLLTSVESDLSRDQKHLI